MSKWLMNGTSLRRFRCVSGPRRRNDFSKDVSQHSFDIGDHLDGVLAGISALFVG